jgi:preprotein translocase subunit SecE
MVLLTIGNLAIQFFGNLTASVQYMAWGSWILLLFVLFMFTSKYDELKTFIQDAYAEIKKVVWPTKPETLQTTFIVFAMVAITGTVLWLLDNFMIWLIAKLARLG